MLQNSLQSTVCNAAKQSAINSLQCCKTVCNQQSAMLQNSLQSTVCNAAKQSAINSLQCCKTVCNQQSAMLQNSLQSTVCNAAKQSAINSLQCCKTVCNQQSAMLQNSLQSTVCNAAKQSAINSLQCCKTVCNQQSAMLQNSLQLIYSLTNSTVYPGNNLLQRQNKHRICVQKSVSLFDVFFTTRKVVHRYKRLNSQQCTHNIIQNLPKHAKTTYVLASPESQINGFVTHHTPFIRLQIVRQSLQIITLNVS